MRCPMHVLPSTRMASCEPDCAWSLKVGGMGKICAIAAIGALQARVFCNDVVLKAMSYEECETAEFEMELDNEL